MFTAEYCNTSQNVEYSCNHLATAGGQFRLHFVMENPLQGHILILISIQGSNIYISLSVFPLFEYS